MIEIRYHHIFLYILLLGVICSIPLAAGEALHIPSIEMPSGSSDLAPSSPVLSSTFENQPVSQSGEVGVLSSSSATGTVMVVGSAPAFMSGWSYRKIHAIGGSPDGDLTDYQMRFVVWNTTGTDSSGNVYLGDKVKGDYSDLRFTLNDNTILSHWVESTSTTAAVVWVRIPSIPTTGTQVYIYYGNPGVSSISNGETTFQLFDSFNESGVNTTKWTVTGSPAITDSTITLSGTAGVESIVSKSSFGTGYRTRMSGTMKASSDGTQGGYGFSALGSIFTWFLTNYPATGSYNVRTSSGTEVSSNLGSGYAGWHIWDVQRTNATTVSYLIDDSVKSSPTTNIPSTNLPVLLLGYQTAADTRADWIFVAKITPNEPQHSSWGSEQTNSISLVSNFTYSTSSGNTPLTVRFFDNSTGNPPLTYQWNFGDDSANSSIQNPTHIYSSGGTYDVALTITNSTGISSTKLVSECVVASELPPPEFLSGWSYRKLHAIAGSSDGTLTDYQMRFVVWNTTGTDSAGNVYLGDKVKSDYSDLRFTLNDNTILSHWVESTSTTAAVVWVRIPSIPTTGTQVYIYYGNPGASSISNGETTFQLFDSFNESGVNTTKWTVAGSPAITDSTITLSGTAGVESIVSKSSFGTGYRTRMSGTMRANSDGTQGGYGFSALGSTFAWFLTNYPATGSYNVRTSSGTEVSSNLGSGYAGWHTWEVQRTNASTVSYLIDDSVKSSPTTNIPSTNLPVLLLGYQTAADTRADWIFVAKITPNEPQHEEWGSEQAKSVSLVSNFTYSTSSGNTPLTVRFFDNSTGNPPLTYQWNFGDDSANSSIQNPTHIYSSGGTYDVALTITNSTGISSTKLVSECVVASELPPPEFLSGWSYRKLHAIAGSSDGTLTDYQMRFVVWNTTGTDSSGNVYLGDKVKSDYSDLRFTLNDNTILSHWVESTSTTAAVVWVRIPSIPTTGTQVYIYYGNPGASSISNGETTFQLFDSFNESGVNTTKWTVAGSPAITDSTITLSGTAGVESIVSKSSFGTGYRTRMSGTMRANSDGTQGGYGFSALGSTFAWFLTNYPTTGSYNVRTSSGTEVSSSLGSGYAGWHTWEVQRTNASTVSYLIDDSVKSSPTTNIPSTNLPVLLLGYQTAADTRADWIFVAKITPNEPQHEEWGSEQAKSVSLVSNFTYSTSSGNTPLTVRFFDNSTGNPPLTYQWNFGDDSANSSIQNPTHIYSSGGTYDVALTITNSTGISSTKLVSECVVASELPPPEFLSGWSYRKLHAIAGSSDGTLTDYQMRFVVWNTTGTDSSGNVYLGDKVKSDYSDLRFTLNDNTILSHWVESTSTTAAVVWVRIPSIPTTGTQVYIYYGNPGASSISNGETTFPLFDSFNESGVNTTKWTVAGSPAITDSTITLSGTAGVESIVSKSSFGTGYRTRMSGTMRANSDGTQGGYGFSALGSTFAWFLTNYPATGSYNVRTSSGTEVSSNLGSGYAGWHTWEVQRTNASTVSYLIDDSVKSSPTTNIPSTNLPVLLLGYQTAADTRADWIFVAKITPNEPQHEEWGSEQAKSVSLVSNFTYSTSSGNTPLTVRFFDNSTGNPPLTYQWNFGDDSANSSIQNPTHIYSSGGTYDVALTITNSTGISSTKLVSECVVASELPPPEFLSGWSYRKLHAIAGSSDGTLTDYQMRFVVWNTTGTDSSGNVYLGDKVKSDYSDLRFTLNDNTILSHWVESTSTTAAVVWVRIPSIPTTGTQVYIYYGNPGASSISNGETTFQLFDSFNESGVNTTKWTVAGSPAITDSTITLSGTAGVESIVSKSSFGTGYRTRMSGTMRANSDGTQGGYGFSALGSTFAWFLTNYPTTGSYNVRTSSGTEVSSSLGSGYAGWHTWEVQRTNVSTVSYLIDDSVKSSPTTNIPSTNLPVLLLGYQTAADTRADWIFVAKITPNEPQHEEWGSEQAKSVSLVSNFTYSTSSGNTPLTVRFFDNSTGNPPLTYQWNFGDDSANSSIQNPTHIYSSGGTYDVALTITNSTGISSTKLVSECVVASELPPPEFLSGWSYRKLHAIAGSSDGTLTDYQMRFVVWNTTGTDSSGNVYLGDKVKSDYSDLRFTLNDNTILSHWVESTSTTAAVVWVRIPSIPTTGTQVYIYYGNPGASSISNGETTFQLFDSFNESGVNTTKWTVAGSPAITDSTITLSGTAGVESIVSKSSFGTGYRTRMSGTMRANSDGTQGGYGFSALGSTFAWFLTNYPTTGSYNVRTSSGTEVSSSLGSGYAGWHTWEVQRTNVSTVSYLIDDSVKSSPTTNIPSTNLPVLLLGYQTAADTRADWIFVAKITPNEPQHEEWIS